ncbi:MAG: M56 family metallopeptidase [Verrucomicrobiae bacterium]|nr:M56 family metallopeptidase [Verrucomicrobiae bacterium]
MNAFFQIVLSNLFFASVLALAALMAERWLRRPALAHLFWLVVFVKLLSPPLVSFDTADIPVLGKHLSQLFAGENAQQAITQIGAGGIEGQTLAAINPVASGIDFNHVWAELQVPFFVIWLCGSVLLLVLSLVRAYRFNRLIASDFSPAPEPVVALLREVSCRLGIRRGRLPVLRISGAELSPMVWWMGGRVSVILPRTLVESLSLQELKWVLGHELAHVQRKDYQVRWLEWLACVAFWWNPLVWWGRRHLRLNEEICCDALVLDRIEGRPYDYAQSLLNAVERLSLHAFGPAPLVASQMNSGNFLEKRLRMMMALGKGSLESRTQRICLLLVAALALPPACLSGKTESQKEQEPATPIEIMAEVEPAPAETTEPAPLPESAQNSEPQQSIPPFSTTVIVQNFDFEKYRQMLEEAQENMKDTRELMARAQRQADELRARMNEHVMKMPPLPPGVRVLPSPFQPEEQKRALRDGIRMLDEAALMHIMDHVSKIPQQPGFPGVITRIEVRLGA